MTVEAERTRNPWVGTPQNSGVLIKNGHDLSLVMIHDDDNDDGAAERGFSYAAQPHQPNPTTTTTPDGKLGLGERAFSAAGAAFLSAIIVNPLDVVKVIFTFLCCFVCFLGH